MTQSGDTVESPSTTDPSPPQRSWRPFVMRLHFYAGVLIAPFILIAALTGGLVRDGTHHRTRRLRRHPHRAPVREPITAGRSGCRGAERLPGADHDRHAPGRLPGPSRPGCTSPTPPSTRNCNAPSSSTLHRAGARRRGKLAGLPAGEHLAGRLPPAPQPRRARPPLQRTRRLLAVGGRPRRCGAVADQSGRAAPPQPARPGSARRSQPQGPRPHHELARRHRSVVARGAAVPVRHRHHLVDARR